MKFEKPMLARDWIEDKVKFPCYIQPKIDGVRAINIGGKLFARSLKQHTNNHVTKVYSIPEFEGFDGEMILGSDPAAKDLCRLTSGAMRREDSVDEFTWYVFDYLHPDVIHLPYKDRLAKLKLAVENLPVELKQLVKVVTTYEIKPEAKEFLEIIDTEFLDDGYEGSIIRDPNSLYKNGRSDGKMQVWRIKRFIDSEFLITGIIEGQHNANEAVTNALGRTERSTHKENMQPNGLVGSLCGTLLADVLDPQSGEVILKKDQEITVSAGGFTEDERKFWFDNQDILIGQIGKFKLFPKGTKDKPRFPVIDSIRSPEDMS